MDTIKHFPWKRALIWVLLSLALDIWHYRAHGTALPAQDPALNVKNALGKRPTQWLSDWVVRSSVTNMR